jgi:hypothetical protein
MAKGYIEAPEYLPDTAEWGRRIAKRLREVSQGKTNNTDEVTLTLNSATTVVTLAPGRLGEDTLILFMPTNNNAALEYGAGVLHVSARDVLNNQFTITHQNNANTRTFKYALIG